MFLAREKCSFARLDPKVLRGCCEKNAALQDLTLRCCALPGATKKTGAAAPVSCHIESYYIFQLYWMPIAFWYISIFSLPAGDPPLKTCKIDAPLTSFLNACM